MCRMLSTRSQLLDVRLHGGSAARGVVCVLDAGTVKLLADAVEVGGSVTQLYLGPAAQLPREAASSSDITSDITSDTRTPGRLADLCSLTDL